MTRVLVLASSYPSVRRPFAGSFVAEWNGELRRAGARVTVVSPEPPAPDSQAHDLHFSCAGSHGGPHRLAPLQGLVDGLPWLGARMAAGAELAARMMWRALDIQPAPDVIQAHWCIPAGLAGAALAMRWNRPLVVTLHSADVHALETLPMGARLACWIADRAALVTATSAHVAERFRRLTRGRFDGRMAVTPMGVHADARCSPGPAPDEPLRVLFVGRLVRQKGVHVLLEALAGVGVPVSAVITGEGPERAALERAAARRGLESRFTGPVSPAARDDLFRRSSVTVAPSLVLSNGRTEGLPRVIVESMARGCPVIGADCGGVREVVRDGWNGYIVRPGDAGEISRRLLELNRDRACSRAMREHAIQSVSGMSWKPCVEAVLPAAA
ncbi:MAG: putative teichuronic acid biosynthesis glycosyltransferase TuaC [Myxococcota bacterium]|nr:putative teichuronic acid biosynthesis glycosyltransferase TuaC [Myxococcota bacterium]